MELLHSNVAIIGAGVAGLAAARLLTRHGLDCILLEAGDAIGGRIRTLTLAGWPMPVELGAEFVHGRPTTTLSLRAGTRQLIPVGARRLENGGAGSDDMQETWKRFAKLTEPARSAPPDQSMRDFVLERRLGALDEQLVRMLVEGYHAAPLDDVSARVIAMDAAASEHSFEQYRVAGGYASVLRQLESELPPSLARIELGARVRSVHWSRNEVSLGVDLRGRDTRVECSRCIMTPSIGVLQHSRSASPRSPDPIADGLEIEPYPAVLRAELVGIGMAPVIKVVLRFENPPWCADPALANVSFVQAPDGEFPTFWREARAGKEQVTAWSGGPRALKLHRAASAELPARALAAFAAAAHQDLDAVRTALLEAHYHDFVADPLTRGAYSYVRPGGTEAARRLSEPVEETLFFAGEALHPHYPSTVAGALGSGERAARRVLVACGR
jgi:hypothetical protein